MRVGKGVEWAIHCCALLAALPAGGTLSASRLAEYHGVAQPYLAKHLQALARAGIIEAAEGRSGGYRLAKPAGRLTLLDIVEAVEGAEPAFRCTEIRRRGPFCKLPAAAFPGPCGIAVAMSRAEDAWRRELDRQTLGDLVSHYQHTADPRAQDRARAWLESQFKENLG